MIPRHFIIAASILLAAALAMSGYAWRMRGRAAATPVAYDDVGVLRAQSAQVPLPSVRQQRAEEVLRALIALYLDKSSPHPLPPGSDIRSVYLVDPGLAVIDLNAAFADGHRSGILAEELSVASLIETLSTNVPGITRVKILVEGTQRDTLAGHADLSNFFDVAAVNQLTSQLQTLQ